MAFFLKRPFLYKYYPRPSLNNFYKTPSYNPINYDHGRIPFSLHLHIPLTNMFAVEEDTDLKWVSTTITTRVKIW